MSQVLAHLAEISLQANVRFADCVEKVSFG
jgi:hypothetical protein